MRWFDLHNLKGEGKQTKGCRAGIPGGAGDQEEIRSILAPQAESFSSSRSKPRSR